MFNSSNRAEVQFYAPNLGLQTVTVNCNDPQGAQKLIERQYGSDVQIMSINMIVG